LAPRNVLTVTGLGDGVNNRGQYFGTKERTDGHKVTLNREIQVLWCARLKVKWGETDEERRTEVVGREREKENDILCGIGRF
jgi:hypothetical protein